MSAAPDQRITSLVFGAGRVLSSVMLLLFLATAGFPGTRGSIFTSVPAVLYQPGYFTLWYSIPTEPGSCVVKVWERDWDGFEWDVNTMVLRHTNGWATDGMTLYVDRPSVVSADVEISCYQDTAYIDDVALVWTYNRLPNPGFEIWFDGELEGWMTQNIFRSRRSHSGMYCVALVSTVVGVEEGIAKEHRPSDLALQQNRPNPFRHSTQISYALPQAANVTLSIYDITGRLVETLVNEIQQSGIHQVRWNRAGNPSGVYFYRLEAGEFRETKKMVVVE